MSAMIRAGSDPSTQSPLRTVAGREAVGAPQIAGSAAFAALADQPSGASLMTRILRSPPGTRWTGSRELCRLIYEQPSGSDSTVRLTSFGRHPFSAKPGRSWITAMSSSRSPTGLRKYIHRNLGSTMLDPDTNMRGESWELGSSPASPSGSPTRSARRAPWCSVVSKQSWRWAPATRRLGRARGTFSPRRARCPCFLPRSAPRACWDSVARSALAWATSRWFVCGPSNQSSTATSMAIPTTATTTTMQAAMRQPTGRKRRRGVGGAGADVTGAEGIIEYLVSSRSPRAAACHKTYHRLTHRGRSPLVHPDCPRTPARRRSRAQSVGLSGPSLVSVGAWATEQAARPESASPRPVLVPGPSRRGGAWVDVRCREAGWICHCPGSLSGSGEDCSGSLLLGSVRAGGDP